VDAFCFCFLTASSVFAVLVSRMRCVSSIFAEPVYFGGVVERFVASIISLL
jgi:hypothetical protein